MKLNELLTLKIVAFLICDFWLMRILVIFLLCIDIACIKGNVKINIFNYFLGVSIIVLNSALSFDNKFENFIILGVFPLFFKKIAVIRYVRIYWLIIVLKGVYLFWVNM